MRGVRKKSGVMTLRPACERLDTANVGDGVFHAPSIA